MGFARNTNFLLSNYTTWNLEEAYYARTRKPIRVVSRDQRSGVLQFGSMVLLRQDHESKHQRVIQINNGIIIKCSDEQYFYTTDGKKVAAMNLEAGMELLNVKTDTRTFVTAIEKARTNELMYASSVPRYGNYALASGVIVKA